MCSTKFCAFSNLPAIFHSNFTGLSFALARRLLSNWAKGLQENHLRSIDMASIGHLVFRESTLN